MKKEVKLKRIHPCIIKILCYELAYKMNCKKEWELCNSEVWELTDKAFPYVERGISKSRKLKEILLVENPDRSIIEEIKEFIKRVINNYRKEGPTVEILLQAHQSDVQDRLVKDYDEYIRKVVWKVCSSVSKEDMEDIVNESWIRVLHDFYFGSKLTTFLYVVILNLCREVHKRRKYISLDQMDEKGHSLLDDIVASQPSEEGEPELFELVKKRIDWLCEQMKEIRKSQRGRKGIDKETKRRIGYLYFLCSLDDHKIAKGLGICGLCPIRCSSCLKDKEIIKKIGNTVIDKIRKTANELELCNSCYTNCPPAWKNEDIADRLGLDPNTVNTIIYRIRKALRRSVQKK